MWTRNAALLAVATLTGCSAPHAAYVAEIDAWHARRLTRLRSDTGMLTLVGLHPLEAGVLTVGSAPDAGIVLSAAAPPRLGVITIGDDGAVTFAAESGVAVEVHEHTPPERVTVIALAPDVPGPPTVLSCGSLLLHVIDRGGTLFLRVRDRRSPALRAFEGVERYPVDERWRVSGVLIPEPGAVLAVTNVLGQVARTPTPGAVEFELDGQTHRLRPTVASNGELFFVFADATTGTETYGGGRYLYADPPGPDGRVELDFNRAYSPYCAFNEFSTCTLPTPGNTLPIAVRAGEKYTP